MDKLRRIITNRDESFEKQTLKIFEMIETSLMCVANFLDSVDPMFHAGDLTWEDVNLEEDLIIMVGCVEYDLGTTIKTDSGMVTITEENVDYFQRVIHMTLPFELVSAGDPDDIYGFLEAIHNDGEGQDFTDIVENAPNNSVDFDLSELTEKQRHSLLCHSFKETKNNN